MIASKAFARPRQPLTMVKEGHIYVLRPFVYRGADCRRRRYHWEALRDGLHCGLYCSRRLFARVLGRPASPAQIDAALRAAERSDEPRRLRAAAAYVEERAIGEEPPKRRGMLARSRRLLDLADDLERRSDWRRHPLPRHFGEPLTGQQTRRILGETL